MSYSLGEWNDDALWRDHYGDLAPNGTCFAQDIFGGQFIVDKLVYLFDPETAETSLFADTIEQWAQNIIDDYSAVLGQPLARRWQTINGSIENRHRLVPLTPFVLGGEYETGNLVSMESSKSMKVRANLARQLRELPDGAKIVYEIVE